MKSRGVGELVTGRLDNGDGTDPTRTEEKGIQGTTLIRSLNMQTVLDAILDTGPISRPAVSAATGLSPPTVSSLISDLETLGLVEEDGLAAGSVGRPAATYSVNRRAGYVFAVDLGADSVTAGIADLFGEVLVERSEPTAREHADATISQLTRLHESLASLAGFDVADAGVGCVGIPGVWPPDQEHASKIVTMPWLGGYPVRSRLQDVIGIPIILENDANLAAIAELWKGRARGQETFVCISVGTGTGMGIIVNGETHRGRGGAAGELALLPIGQDPYDDELGARGPFQAAAAGPSIMQRLADALSGGAETALSRQSSVADILSAASKGDPVAVRILDDEARTLALGVASAVALLDPTMVVIGGEVGSDPRLVDSVRGYAASLVPDLPEVVPSSLANRAVLEGAIVAALQAVRSRILAGIRAHH